MRFEKINEILSYSYREDRYPPTITYQEITQKKIYDSWRSLDCGSVYLPLGLYVHFPFCPRKCLFCYCNSYESTDREFIKRYIDLIIAEMESYAWMRSGFNSLYFGGGTPSYMTISQIDSLFRYIRKTFNILKDAQIQFDCSPLTLSDEKIECLRKNSVNRITLGIQSFESSVLSANRRYNGDIKPLADKIKCFAKLNIDLIAGLDRQDETIFIDDVKKAIALNPSMIHLYPLTPTSATIFKRKEDVAGWIKRGQKLLLDAGYRLIEDDGFGLDDDSRNVQETDLIRYNSNVLGIGNGAQSHIFSRLSYITMPDVKEYMRRMDLGLDIHKGIDMDIRREMIWHLLHKQNIDKDFFMRLFGKDPFELFPGLPKDSLKRAEFLYEKEVIDLIVRSGNRLL